MQDQKMRLLSFVQTTGNQRHVSVPQQRFVAATYFF
jgi:hypothetical protein